jgi:hypothetical protein
MGLKKAESDYLDSVAAQWGPEHETHSVKLGRLESDYHRYQYCRIQFEKFQAECWSRCGIAGCSATSRRTRRMWPERTACGGHPAPGSLRGMRTLLGFIGGLLCSVMWVLLSNPPQSAERDPPPLPTDAEGSSGWLFGMTPSSILWAGSILVLVVAVFAALNTPRRPPFRSHPAMRGLPRGRHTFRRRRPKAHNGRHKNRGRPRSKQRIGSHRR